MPPTYPYRATALMKYKSAPGGPPFSFGAGEALRVLAAADEEGDWLEGENGKGEKGVFPSSFVKELEEEEEERADSASPEAAGTAQNDEAEQKAKETIEATPEDDTNVVEGSESTPADEPALAAESTSPPAPSKVDAPPETLTSPTVADVTPSSTATTEVPAKSASPPPPAKKPNALASRIAAFNAAAQQQTPPPVAPKPKPRQWARPAAPPPSAGPTSDAPPAPAPAPVVAPADSAPAAPSATDEAQSQAQRDFSAEDAQESISRGGGSLRDRIKALQGGLKMEQPPAPGRAPPKPWRKPSAEPEAAEEGEKTQQDEAEILQDAVVKDERPREDETNAQSPGAEVPGFDPAESDSPFVPSSVAGDDEQEVESNDATEPASSDAVKQESVAASIAAPAAVEEEEQDSTVSSVAVPVESEEVKPVQDESAAPTDEDDEELKRANLAARMANLGGQRMGLPMPALPKRAAGPRARKAKAAVSPAAVEVEKKALGEKDKPAKEEATTDKPVAPGGTEDAEASVVQPPQEVQEEHKAHVLASMGGESALLAQDDDEEDTRAKAPVDDDFDSPAPPAPPQRTIPPLADESEPAVEAEETSTGAPPPPPLSSRPPLPPSFASEDADESTDDLPESGAAPRSPPPPTRPLDPPAFSSGAETITDEARPTAHDPEHDQAGDVPVSAPPLPKGRPPVPPAFVRQATEQPAAAEPDKEEEEEAKDDEEPQHPPLPTHPAPLGEQRVTTAAEDAFIAQMPEIVTPPEEAADESTAAPSLNAPTTETIAQGRIEDGHEPADMGQPAWGKVEGTETPAVELSPPALAPKMLAKEEANDVPAEQKQDEEEDEEEEEEDPEIARRRALAARMAKLGGRGPLMGGPMLGFGGLPPKKPAKKKPTSELAEQGDLNAAGGPKPDEPAQRDEEESAPAPPPRRPGGIPAGGFALPGIAPLRLPPQHEPEEQPSQTEEESEPLPTSGKTLAEKSAAATDQAFARTDQAFTRTDQERKKMQDAEVAPPDEEEVQEEQVVEQEEVPPPLPPSRPSTLPPRRSVPIPAEEEQPHGDDAADGEPEQPDVLGQARQVAEPEACGEEPQAEQDEDDLPPPPPPPRPAGGHQSSLPLAPPMPPTRAIPSSPPTHPAPNPIFLQQDDAELARTATQSSRKSSINPPRSSLDVPFEPLRADSTSSSQAQYPTSSTPNLDALLQWSASLGAQVFAAAHTKMSDKQARGLSDADLIHFCFSRATDPLPPIGGQYGVRIYEATVEQGKKVPLVREDDEPRAGDVVTIAAKFKHNLSSKTFGSVEAPHVAIVAGWDAKKGKLKVVEVEGKSGTVDEGSYRIDEMRAGQVVVYRVAPKDHFE
ncbi:assembly of actin patch protein [Rhodotorula toruloides]